MTIRMKNRIDVTKLSDKDLVLLVLSEFINVLNERFSDILDVEDWVKEEINNTYDDFITNNIITDVYSDPNQLDMFDENLHVLDVKDVK